MSNTAPSESRRRIYLDYAAATPLSFSARRTMARASRLSGNPSSLHSEGRAARASLEHSRAQIARVLNAAPSEILFTGSGSEADALALRGVAQTRRAQGRHIIISAIEHKAILKTAESLEREGFSITRLMPDTLGRITTSALEAALRPDTILVSIMYANNEIGTVEPIRKLAKVVHASSNHPLFHTDACQAPGSLLVDVQELGVDLMTVNSSKVYGPKGIGALYVRRGIALEPIVGGEQEGGVRGGTESVVLAAGFATALLESEARRPCEAPRLAKLRDLFFTEILARIPDAKVHGPRAERLPNNVHVSIPGIEGESILLLLDAAGIACATGSACNSLDLAPSHVLLAIGEDAGLSHGSVRFSLGRGTRRTHVVRAARELEKIVHYLRGVSALTLSARSRITV